MTQSDETQGTTPRERRRHETAERILDAAMELMSEGGYEGFTIARLAGELDCAVGALYRYFSGKDAILAALQHRCVNRIAEDLRAVGAAADEASSDLDPGDAALLQVLSAVTVYESLPQRRPTDYRLLAMSLGDPRHLLATELVRGVFDSLRGVLSLLSQHLEAAAVASALQGGSATDRAYVLWGAVQGLLQLRKLERVESEVAEQRLTDELLCTLLAGWGAERDRARELLGRARALVARL